jgi:Tol biopolymer transport system component/predicted Ser/Thr protein kinase
MTGRTFAHYRIEEQLGEGGMGVVYKAFDTHLDRPVAIKVLRPEAVADPERRRRFVQEAKAASALNHPNIITIYDIDTAEGVDFIAMEYVPGATLDQKLGRRGLVLSEALKYGIQTADALAQAHGAGIIHRDLKPANLMVTEDGRLKVLDFGLAKLTESTPAQEATQTLDKAAGRTQEGTIVGTVAYMSPEQAQGKKIDARSDIFSFGSVLYEMISGRRAFEGQTKISTLAAILNQEPRPASDVLPGLPREMERILNRCLRKDPARRFQTMADLKVALEELKEESESGRLVAAAPMARPRIPMAVLVAGVLAVMAATAGVTWWLLRSRTPPRRDLKLTRLTSDAGLTTDPALSPDGKLVAYASDRAGEGNLDIWVQPVAGGRAVRLTTHEGDDHQPSFSPDGTTLAFRSEREGGGIYVVSVLGGGDDRLIAKEGRLPRFSPDGKQIAYTVGHAGGALVAPGSGKINLVASTGGTPRQFQMELSSAAFPVWSPDGGHLLFQGTAPGERRLESVDWWVAPVAGGAAVRTGALAALRRQGLSTSVRPSVWLDGPDRILFSGQLGDSRNLWQVPIGRDRWQITRPAERLTSGAGLEVQPAATTTRVVFASLTENIDLWGLPIDANQGNVRGAFERLTQEAGREIGPSLTPDGSKMAFLSAQSGRTDVWLKDLKTGKETALTMTPEEEFRAAIAPDGSRMAYGVREGQKLALYVVTIGSGGAPGIVEKVCDDCGLLIAWSPDGKRILHGGALGERGVSWLDLTTGRNSQLFQGGRGIVESVSADNRWIALAPRLATGRARVVLVPVHGGGSAAPESDWISITEGQGYDTDPRFSPDGNIVYFLSDRDGSRCVWAQRLDPATKKLAGAAWEVHAMHAARRSAVNIPASMMSMAVSRTRIVFPVMERTGNIWMAEVE